MKAGFIGAGKVGFSLGKFFSKNGIQVTGYFSRNPESAADAAAFTNSKRYISIEDIVRDSDAIFLTVPDGVISSIYEEIIKLEILDKQICHCSGALSAQDAFPEIDKCGAYGYSIHPLFPISSKLTSYRELGGAFFCLEGNGPHLEIWERTLNNISRGAQVISAGAKTKYHAACAISSNLVCGLVYESIRLLQECGFDESMSLKALSPLLKSNMDHIISDGPINALTGPVERGDAGTVAKHMNLLETTVERELYRNLSLKLVEVAMDKNPTRDYSQLEEILKEKERDEKHD